MKKQPKATGPKTAPKVQAVVDAAGHTSKTDPQGSYTGNPREPGERPVQDADDL